MQPRSRNWLRAISQTEGRVPRDPPAVLDKRCARRAERALIVVQAAQTRLRLPTGIVTFVMTDIEARLGSSGNAGMSTWLSSKPTTLC